MHSRIVELSDNTTFKNYDEDEIFKMMYGDADYVRTVGYNEDDAEWLFDREGLLLNPKFKTLKILSKKDYFKNKFEEFKQAMVKLITEGCTFEQYVNGHPISFNLFNLQDSFDGMGLKIVYDGCVMSMDSFMRKHAEEGKIYNIGEIYDYHF